MSGWRRELERISGVSARWDIDLTAFSTFRMKARGDLLVIATAEALAQVVRVLNRERVSYRPLGWGANQVLAPTERDVLLQLDFPVLPEALREARESYVLPASVGLNHLTAHALTFGLKGWEVLTGVPASLGGAIYMNAGTSHGEICQILKTVDVMATDGTVRTEVIGPQYFSYRKNHFVKTGEIIIGAELIHHGLSPEVPDKIRRYLELRRQSQPLATKNCGCVFKNVSPSRQAGRLIDLTGLKGLSVGALRVSEKHANFMENTGGASAEEFQRLVALINKQMQLHWGVGFELEVKALYP